MANQCEFKLKATGLKEDVNNLSLKLKQYQRTDIVEEEIEEHDNRFSTLTIDGYCDWSVYSSMIEGHNIQDSLITDSKDYGVIIEVYSSEPGIGFQEHYIIKKGEFILDDIEDYREINVKDYLNNPDNYEEIREELEVTHEDIHKYINENKDEEWIGIGGFQHEFKDFYKELQKVSLKDKIDKLNENTQQPLQQPTSKDDKTRS